MATADDGIISVSYRPLATMDELHVLLLAAVSVQTVDVTLLVQVFSLPRNVVVNELAVLEAYGLAEKLSDTWTATNRGQRLTAVWNTFQNSGEAKVETSGRQWLLGPGEFAVDEMIRDQAEIEALAHSLGVANVGSAANFLDGRRRNAEKFEAFVRDWPSPAQDHEGHCEFAETLVFNSLKLAETDEALTRLEVLFAAHVGEVMHRFKKTAISAVHADGDGTDGDIATSIHNVMKRFEDEKRIQRRQNQNLAKVKMVCEAVLAGQWLSANFDSLADAFNSEPAAFIFRSTVPFARARKSPHHCAFRAP